VTTTMPSFSKGQISDEDLDALMEYLISAPWQPALTS